MYEYYNPNPKQKHVGDCTVRAISKALNMDWHEAYICLALQGLLNADMPSSNAVWGEFLKDNGFKRRTFQNVCPECYTVENFCIDNPYGTYILALQTHVVCVKNGVLYDSWDSRQEEPLYCWFKEVD
jgi:hypothetical protein